MFHNLRKIRLEKKMTLKYVSEKLTIAESTLSKIETGQQGLLSDTAIQLANLFKVSLDELLGREFENPKTTVIKTIDFDYEDILQKLNTFDTRKLIMLQGAIEYILKARNSSNINDQQAKNVFDKALKSIKDS